MTIREAVAYIRMLIDESGIEAYTDDNIIDAVSEAAVVKAREYYQRGEKEAIRSLYREELVAGTSGQLAEPVMNIEVCLLKTQSAQVSPQINATYVSPLEYREYQFLNPSTNSTISGRAEYSYDNNTIFHNGTSALVCYYRLPTAIGLAQQIELAGYVHPQVADYAAAKIMRSEVLDTDHQTVGKMYDIEAILTEFQQIAKSAEQ